MKAEEKRYCLRKADMVMMTGERIPQYLSGVAYAAPGKPVPYWDSELVEAKLWKTPRAAFQAQKKFGGLVRLLRVDQYERPVKEIGTLTHHEETEDEADWPIPKRERIRRMQRR